MKNKKKELSEFRVYLMLQASSAIDEIADDKSVSCEKSIEDLQELTSLIDCAIDGLRNDIKNRGSK